MLNMKLATDAFTLAFIGSLSLSARKKLGVMASHKVSRLQSTLIRTTDTANKPVIKTKLKRVTQVDIQHRAEASQ